MKAINSTLTIPKLLVKNMKTTAGFECDYFTHLFFKKMLDLIIMWCMIRFYWIACRGAFNMGKVDNRKNEILKMLSVDESLGVDDLVKHLNVSEATVRRMLSMLEIEEKIIRTHGGARLMSRTAPDYSFYKQSELNIAQKEAIGIFAARLVNPKEVLFLDSGTTVLSAAKAMAGRIEAGQLKGISVVTNSIIVAEVLGSLCKVILLGGEVRLFRKDISGPLVERYIKMFRADKAFVGTDGLTTKDGLMTTDEYTSYVDGEMIKRSSQSILVADSSKFNKPSFVSYAQIDEIDLIITDSLLPESIRREYENYGVKIEAALINNNKEGFIK